jgi:hypothetical protein
MDSAVEAALTEVERAHFVGEERKDGNGKPYWIAKRVELNDLSSPELVEYVERKLQENGARPKVIPLEDALKERGERMYRAMFASWVDSIITETLATGELKKKMAEKFKDRFKLQGAKAWIEAGFKRDDTQCWKDPVNGTLQKAYEAKHKQDLEDAVREFIRETVTAEDEE